MAIRALVLEETDKVVEITEEFPVAAGLTWRDRSPKLKVGDLLHKSGAVTKADLPIPPVDPPPNGVVLEHENRIRVLEGLPPLTDPERREFRRRRFR